MKGYIDSKRERTELPGREAHVLDWLKSWYRNARGILSQSPSQLALGLFVLLIAGPTISTASDQTTMVADIPETFGFYLVSSNRYDRYFYYCYDDIKYFMDPNSINCENTYNSMSLSWKSFSLVGFPRSDNETLYRVLEYITQRKRRD